jgi:transcriptional regulator with GAF, ATPase, and Fis domain
MGREEIGPVSFEHFVLSAQEDSIRTVSGQQHDFLPLDKAMTEHIQQALRLRNGKVFGEDGAAQLLGINPNTLRSRMKKLGIPFKNRDKS